VVLFRLASSHSPVEVPAEIAVTIVLIADLPAEWDANEPIGANRDIGTNWAKELATAVLSVPSAVIPRERNYLLNPAHQDFARIRFFDPEPFYFDDRLGRRK
jgi:RES domain-containing protein